MPIRHLQRIAKTKVRKSAVRIELGNNGGEFDGVVVTMLFEQRGDERFERSVVERMELRRGVEPFGFGFCRAVLPGCGGMPQKSQES